MDWKNEYTFEDTDSYLRRGALVGISLPEFKLFAAQRGGRGSNGHERDHGKVLHAVSVASANEIAFSLNSALCGVAPGPRSTGWSCTVKDAENVTCSRCLKRMAAWPVGVR